MITKSPDTRRFGLRWVSHARALLAVSALAALAVPNRAAAAAFAATTLSPSTQTVNVGMPCSVNVRFAVGSYTANGIQAWIKFDPTKLQVASVTTGNSSPFTNIFANQVDNTNGTLTYGATGGSVSNATFTVATIVFTPIAAGTSPVQFSNVNEYIVGYGPYGVNGLAVGGSITVTAPLPTQTLTILGASGNVGDIAPNTEYYNPATGNWQPAYLTGWHPWGFVAGTNSWINYKPSSASDPGVSTDRNNPWWYLYRVRITVPANTQNPKMTFSVKADNWAQVAVNGVSTGPAIEGQANQVNADAVFSQNLQPGENTITINVGDYGGLNGFNFRIDLSVESDQPLEIVPAAPADTTPPVISAPADITKEATGPSGAIVDFSTSAVDDVDGRVPVTASPASGTTFALGTTSVGLAAADAAGNTATASFTVTVEDTTPPTIDAQADLVVEATSAAGAVVTFSPSGTDLVDGSVDVTASPASGSVFPLGTTTVTLTAIDSHRNRATNTFTVTVRDTTAPAIASVTPSTATLWPPNHQMVAVTLRVGATDAVGVTGYQVTATSSEPDNGLGDGDTANDIQITGSGTLNPTISLRAERSGKGSGRIYTITVVAVDEAGNASAPKTVTVSVPKSQGGK